jgi:hypothetical protein
MSAAAPMRDELQIKDLELVFGYVLLTWNLNTNGPVINVERF